MSTVTISPRYRSRDDLAKAPAKLATTMLEVVAAGSADGARFGRGRAYARDGAVVVLHVSTGRLEAEVAGSRSSEYEVTIDVVLARGTPDASYTPAAIVQLVPEPDDLRYSCTCPDQSEACKHAVAALIAFAAEVGDRPDLLRLWRVAATERARVGAAKEAAGRAPAERPARVEPWEQPAWHQYLGTADDSPTAPDVHALLPPLLPVASERVGQFDVTAFVRSARDAVARMVGRDARRSR